jgi:hypothetical protein
MDPVKISESAQFARKLYQAVMSLKSADVKPAGQVHRMTVALAQVMATRPHGQDGPSAA